LVGLFASFSIVGRIFPPDIAAWIVVPLIALWGFVGFSFPSPQQSLIVALAPKLASITLSLNASAIYFGASLGALLGSLVMAHGSAGDLGWVAAGCEATAFLLVKFARRRRAVADPAARPMPEPMSEAA